MFGVEHYFERGGANSTVRPLLSYPYIQLCCRIYTLKYCILSSLFYESIGCMLLTSAAFSLADRAA